MIFFRLCIWNCRFNYGPRKENLKYPVCHIFAVASEPPVRLDRDFFVYTLRGMITFDGRKRKANIAKHGIDLAEVESAFDSPMVTIEDDRVAYGEQRLKSLAWWNGRVVVLLWTERDSGAHVFSCQDADKSQTRQYVKAITGR